MIFNYPTIALVSVRTTCETYSQTVKQKEIIEIGLCLLDHKGRRYDPISFFIKPKKSKVSEHCTRITGITQKDATAGITLDEAFTFFARAYDTRSMPWASYGAFTRQCLDHGTGYNSNKLPFSTQWINVQKEFSAIHHIECGIKTALSKLKIPEVSNLTCEDEVLNVGLIINQIRNYENLRNK